MSIAASEYTTLGQRDHIYLNGDTELGGTTPYQREEWLLNLEPAETGELTLTGEARLHRGKITMPPACERIFLEILSNACDNVIRSRQHGVSSDVIQVSMNNHWVGVVNDGIPVTVDRNDDGVWVPQFVFGKLRTSSNYDSSKDRVVAGKNGYGAKLTNIFSHEFRVDIGDAKHRRRYQQTWRDNMKTAQEPIITEGYEGPSYTSVMYKMDFPRFAYEEYPPEAWRLFAAHCAVASFVNDVTVTFNQCTFQFASRPGQEPPFAGLFPAGPLINSGDRKNTCILIYHPFQAFHMSFVNGIPTRQGGVHTKYVYEALAKRILPKLNESLDKTRRLTPKVLHQHVTVILNCRGVKNPAFSGQTKDKLISPPVKVGWNLDEVIGEIMKWDLVKRLQAEVRARSDKLLKKSDGKKTAMVNVDKLQHDANHAGTAKSYLCTLFVVEGQSAAKYAEKFISQLEEHGGKGNDFFGIYAVQGKPINVYNNTLERLAKNRELTEIKEVMGLREGVDYSIEANARTLRYGKFVVLADADVDGKHIIGLITLLVNHLYPGLIDRKMFYFLRTPILRVEHKRRRNDKKSFLTDDDYEKWRSRARIEDWDHNYFKGLSTSTDEHIREDVSKFEEILIGMLRDENTEDKLRLAFDKTLSAARKTWLARSDVEKINSKVRQLPISRFIDTEVFQHAVANLERNIPKFDGLKLSQRKIMWTALEQWKSPESRKRKKKTTDLVIETRKATNYHYGETSLGDAIGGMVLHHVGSNNLPYFAAASQTGSRYNNVVPQPRYTAVGAAWWWDYVFRPEDRPILVRTVDEGQEGEPVVMLPVVPLGLINGGLGVGTGYSTFIPNHNPLDIIAWLQARLSGRPTPDIKPWYRDFKGNIEIHEKTVQAPSLEIHDQSTENPDSDSAESDPDEIPAIADVNLEDTRQTGDGRFVRRTMVTQGVCEVEIGETSSKYTITEIPIATTIVQYSKHLRQLAAEGMINRIKENCTTNSILFTFVAPKGKGLHKFNKGNWRTLKLEQRFGISNIVLLDEKSRPVRFDDIPQFLEAWTQWRFPYYEKRRLRIIADYQSRQRGLEVRLRFLRAVVNGDLVVTNRGDAELRRDMEAHQLPFELLDTNKVRDMTHDKIARLEQQLAALMEELRVFSGKTPVELWLSDLAEFEKHYRVHYRQ